MFFRILLLTLLSVMTKAMYLLVSLKDDVQEDNGLHFENWDGPASDQEEGPLGGDAIFSRLLKCPILYDPLCRCNIL